MNFALAPSSGPTRIAMAPEYTVPAYGDVHVPETVQESLPFAPSDDHQQEEPDAGDDMNADAEPGDDHCDGPLATPPEAEPNAPAASLGWQWDDDGQWTSGSWSWGRGWAGRWQHSGNWQQNGDWGDKWQTPRRSNGGCGGWGAWAGAGNEEDTSQ